MQLLENWMGFFPFVYNVSVDPHDLRVHVLFGSFKSMDNLLGPLVLLLKLGGESVVSGSQENPSWP